MIWREHMVQPVPKVLLMAFKYNSFATKSETWHNIAQEPRRGFAMLTCLHLVNTNDQSDRRSG